MVKIKKIIIIASIVVAVAVLATVLIIALNNKEHEHEFAVTEVVEPTCTEKGYTKLTCQCGKTKIENEKGTVEHTQAIYGNSKKATCEQEGSIFGAKCSVCGKILKEPQRVDKLGHNFVDGECTRCQKKQDQAEISSLSVKADGEIVTMIEASVGDKIQLDLVINDGADLSKYPSPKATWELKGDYEDSVITEDGLLTVGNVIGNIYLKVSVKGANTKSLEMPIKIDIGENVINSLSVRTKEGFSQEYSEGDVFDPKSITLWGECEDKKVRILSFDWDRKPLNSKSTYIEVTYGELTVDVPLSVRQKELQSIEIVTPADKTVYYEGQCFDKQGLVIKAVFENSFSVVTDFAVDETEPLTVEDEYVVISYSFNGVVKTVKHTVTVVPKELTSITVDSSNVRKIYTQGEQFDPTGLIVYGNFEIFGSLVISEFEYSTQPLTIKDKEVEISYTVGEKTMKGKVEITVVKPYEKISRLEIGEPKDVIVNWSYTYMTDGGEIILDNTAYMANELTYDKENGIYDIPFGAIVTLTITNPNIVSIKINGEENYFDYEERSVTVTKTDDEEWYVETCEMNGYHTVIRFEGDGKEQSFLCFEHWDGYLTPERIGRLGIVFNDTEEYYYAYLYDGRYYTVEELSAVKFNANSQIPVVKIIKTDDYIDITLYLGDQSYVVPLDKKATLDSLPKVTRVGYTLIGWSLTENGAAITNEELASLMTNQDRHLYAIWEKETVDYSNIYVKLEANGSVVEIQQGGMTDGYIQLSGKWSKLFEHEGESLECEIEFLTDGTFTYTVKYNGQENCKYTGFYRVGDGEISVISVETQMEIPLVSKSAFIFTVADEGIIVPLFIIENGTLTQAECTVSK